MRLAARTGEALIADFVVMPHPHGIYAIEAQLYPLVLALGALDLGVVE